LTFFLRQKKLGSDKGLNFKRINSDKLYTEMCIMDKEK
jgi:hypothetical protein